MMANKLSNNPPVVLELEPDLADFLVENCEANLRMGMNILQNLNAVEGSKDRKFAEKLVDQLEKFRKLRKLVEEAKHA